MKSLPYLPLLVLLGFSACTNPADSSASSATIEQASLLPDSVYMAQGKMIAAATFATLSANLQGAMQAGGVAEAAHYCKLAAYPLVDSLSEVYAAQIRRTSTRVRNPENTPDSLEAQLLTDYAQAKAAGQTLAPRLVHLDEQTVGFYAPIVAMDFCLKCHGTVGQEITIADYALIEELYPEDQAVGFGTGDLRGIWSIEMSTQNAAAYK